MTFLAIMAAVVALQGGWTWTLYEDAGPLVLAHEIPDTPQLRAVLECQPGAGVAHIDLYGSPGATGIATMSSGSATATSQSEAAGDHQSVVVRTDHPVFGQFVLSGDLHVAVAGRHQAVAVDAGHLAKLRRFAELCGG